MALDTLVVFAAQYETVELAEQGYDALIEFYRETGIIDTFDAAVVVRDADGKVSVPDKREEPTRHGAWGGLAGGLAVGALCALFPAVGIGAGLLVGGGAGAAIGAVTGHVTRGMKRSDLAELGETLDKGTAGLIVVAATDVEGRITALLAEAERSERRELKADRKEIDKEIKELEKN